MATSRVVLFASVCGSACCGAAALSPLGGRRSLYVPRRLAAAPSLLLEPCNSSSPLQQFELVGGAVHWTGGGSGATSCVTYDTAAGYDAPLVLTACTPGAATQAWAYAPAPLSAFSNPSGSCAGSAGVCLQWSGQEAGQCVSNPPVLGPGCRIGVWPTSSPTSWNNQFAWNGGAESPGTIEAVWASAAGPTPSGVCASAALPPPPARPTADILAWSEKEVMCLYDFDMCTMVGSQGCECSAAPPPASTWHAPALDTDAWLAAGVSAGCKVHILVAKHMCGWVLWPSHVGDALGYNYSTAFADEPVDVVAAFVASAVALGQDYGMYYSLTNNARTNTCAGSIGPTPAPGQIGVDAAQYNEIVLGHLGELWGNYGNLTEVWFDGGFTPELEAELPALLARLQPHAVGFNAGGLMPSPSRWIGSESGFAPYPTWSTCDWSGDGAGDPDSADWYPAETDFTVLAGDTWFFDPATPVRPPGQLQAMYEASVGHNTNALIGLGIAPNGSVPVDQAAALAGLGAYVAGCYGAPVLTTSGTGTLFTLMPSVPTAIDRAFVSENQTAGQLVRGFTLTFLLSNGSSLVVDSGPSIGHKKISVLPEGLVVAMATLNITAAVAPPTIAAFSLFQGCGALGRALAGVAAEA